MFLHHCINCGTPGDGGQTIFCSEGVSQKSPHEWDAEPITDELAAINPKDLLGASKPQMGLIPVGAMEAVARVMELGAQKYGPYNWRTKPVKLMVYAHAGLRHLFAWIGGESVDPESGQSHLAHCAACMFIMLDAMANKVAKDDRTWPLN